MTITFANWLTNATSYAYATMLMDDQIAKERSKSSSCCINRNPIVYSLSSPPGWWWTKDDIKEAML